MITSSINRFLGLVFFLQAIMLFSQNNMPLLAEFQGEHNGSSFGRTLVSLDLNHDNNIDLVVLSLGYGWAYPSTPSRGKVYVYYGGPNFSSNTSAAMTLEGDYQNGFGRKITFIKNIGDVSGDGFDDLLILDTVPGSSGSTRYMYFYGQTDDLTAPDRIESRPISQSVYYFSGLGDIDGDGYDDQGFGYTDQGVYIFDIQWGGTFFSQTILEGEGSSSYLCGIECIGDINNDGYDDFAIGTVHNAQYNIIRIYYGNQQRDFTNPIVLIQTTANIARISKALGDINADGYADFLGYTDFDGLKVWYGSDNLNPAIPSVVLNPIYYGDEYMNGIGYGDINGDGYVDVVGASYNQQRFAVWLGNSAMNGYADWIKFNVLENYCYSLAMGDYNGDGFCDIAVSAPFEEGVWPYHNYTGYVFVYAGNTQMVANDDPYVPVVIEQISVRISPNPVRSDGIINIEIVNHEHRIGQTAKIQIFNLKGQLIYQSTEIDISTDSIITSIKLPATNSGVYLCSVRVGNIEQTKKITFIK